ncbi:chaplin family protein [Streptomyces sp. BE20]|uniref:chaplin family protein n=1 Tax=Streptomyces sp. BE20 TaxID=3002525 RepID=UPI002E78FC1A|nr:chaplin family protein [Streptomyces sp. BE20]MEE1825134.1 chaplin family protein [Streptomyces sp. BE20]
MTNTRKYLLAAGLSAALAVISAGPALAGGCDDSAHSAPTQAAPPSSAFLGGGGGGGGTTCINTGGAYASGVVAGSPGVLSGNQIQIPISIPINICGNGVSVL